MELIKVPPQVDTKYQDDVTQWAIDCFGVELATDTIQRNNRFLEEALELVQACDCPRVVAHKLVDYVYDREVGEKSQEVGGVMVTLGTLCSAHGINLNLAANTELTRILSKKDLIRSKQKKKPL